ncbi:MAG: ABC transporter permease [Sphaerochaeta sp.]|jgi:putative aldouronate transport system permease protein|uniref:ABC transporter permease n=1 Tax=unclassified Sphaerochaeta TaxID=2637943 RepID=UPI000B03297C|nr:MULTISPECIES: ABC transporter permease subunit [unclassified Sphaerochaeta]MCK9600989.1 ABC transporter permease subunit [Sphaerochaeta sp.]MDX9825053.1 ABC transporter permease subunit [Sphaerochaeta sp.]HBO35894.1 protein lplB [Sphaerochaeta sp.]HPE93130.1 ABC transporter permease subunit [Sphaerochaeta sp.]
MEIKRAWKQIKAERVLYLLLLPTLTFFVLFRVLPILNMRLAFFQFRARGDWPFVGLKYFEMIFSSPAFAQILGNTLIISFMKYVLLFPFFVIFALMLNEIRSFRFRKYVQVVSYLPHFLSWVVIAGIWINALSLGGSVNQIVTFFGGKAVDFMTDRTKIRWILMLCEAWRSLGWDSIIFYTAILAISPSLYEAAQIDGASRMQIITNIILPALVTPMITMFILNLGFFLNAGFDQVFNFSNQAVESTIDILDTYIYRIGIEGGQYSLATAVSLIKGLVGVVLVYTTHVFSKKMTGSGVW